MAAYSKTKDLRFQKSPLRIAFSKTVSVFDCFNVDDHRQKVWVFFKQKRTSVDGGVDKCDLTSVTIAFDSCNL